MRFQHNNLKAVFMVASMAWAGTVMKAQQTIANPFLREAKVELGGSFAGTTLNGKPFDESVLKGKDILLYFGTANQLPSCANTLKHIDRAIDKMKENCPERAGNIAVVFVAPDYTGSKQQKNIEFAACEGFIVLRGSQAVINKIAYQWRAQYFKNGEHTQFIYPVNIGQKSRKFLSQDPTSDYIAEAFGCRF